MPMAWVTVRRPHRPRAVRTRQGRRATDHASRSRGRRNLGLCLREQGKQRARGRGFNHRSSTGEERIVALADQRTAADLGDRWASHRPSHRRSAPCDARMTRVEVPSVVVDGSANHQALLVRALQDLVPEQLDLRRSDQWAVWQLAGHIAGARAYWFYN